MSKNIRERKCLVTGVKKPSSELIRFVLDPTGNIIPDVAAKLPGRGCWIAAERDVLEKAVKKGVFFRFGHHILSRKKTASRARPVDVETLEEAEPAPAKKSQKVLVQDDLVDLVERLMLQRCLDYLGLANRSGRIVSGFEKVHSILKSGKGRILIEAADAAENGRSKMRQGLAEKLDKLRVINVFSRDQLGQALGLSNAVHLALLPGGMSESFLKELSRYEGLRCGDSSIE